MADNNILESDSGQTLIIGALVMTVLLLCTGMAIDVGLLYVTKAKLQAAVDSGCLKAVTNLSQGQTTAATMGTDMFDANFGSNPPTPSVTFPIDSHGNQEVQVTATAYVATLFMRQGSVPVSATAVATRGKLIMSMVLDRSGSMQTDGGGAALQSAVPTLVGMLNNTLDEVALISFSENSTIDFPIGYNFITPIDNAVSAMTFAGGTFGTGAGTQAILSTSIGAPMSLADLQNNSVTITPGQNVSKVLLYFTDGLMNTVQDKFHCDGRTSNTLTLINYGGFDSGSEVDIFDPTSPTTVWDTYTGGSGGFKYDTAGDICKNASGGIVTTFLSQQTGLQTALNRANVTAEAQYRAIQTAIAMRTESPTPTAIYTIGLGSSVSPATQAFLAQLANDPAYPATYISGQAAGEFFYVPDCPSQTCTTSLNTVFETIAASVLLRLTD